MKAPTNPFSFVSDRANRVPKFRLLLPVAIAGLLPLTPPVSAVAAELEASDGVVQQNNYFGYFSAVSGSIGLVGAASAANGNGAGYVFRGLDTATGAVTENVRLIASDGAPGDLLGWGVSLSGTTALLGASAHDTPALNQGAAYVFRNLDTTSGAVTQSVKLQASDGAASDQFSSSVALSGSIGLVGANTHDASFSNQGAAYVFRNLDTATGTVTQNAKLIASDAAVDDSFGIAAGVSGTIGVVGAFFDDDKGSNSGSAYVFRNLDTVTGTVTESAKLVASDGAAGDNFGNYLSVSGTAALVSAYLDDDKGSNSGSVYLFRDLDTATGTVSQTAKLTASDGGGSDNFGYSVGLSGSTGIIGAWQDDDKANNAGAAYLFRNLDTATGSVTETVKITASNGASQDNFGHSVAIDGDTFVVGASRGDGIAVNSGNAYSGSVSSVTTLDAGNTAKTISGISFVSRDSWTIGKATDGNSVVLSAGNTATVTAAGKGVFIGAEAGSDANTLRVAGRLVATDVFVGSIDGNDGNALRLDATATFTIQSINLAAGNSLFIEGDYSSPSGLLTYLGSTSLKVWDQGAWVTVTAENYGNFVTGSYGSGFTAVTAVPEPGVTGALFGLGIAAICYGRWRKRAAARAN